MALATVGRSVGLRSESGSESVLNRRDRPFMTGLLSGVDSLDGIRVEPVGLVCELPLPCNVSLSFRAHVFPHVGNARL